MPCVQNGYLLKQELNLTSLFLEILIIILKISQLCGTHKGEISRIKKQHRPVPRRLSFVTSSNFPLRRPNLKYLPLPFQSNDASVLLSPKILPCQPDLLRIKYTRFRFYALHTAVPPQGFYFHYTEIKRTLSMNFSLVREDEKKKPARELLRLRRVVSSGPILFQPVAILGACLCHRTHFPMTQKNRRSNRPPTFAASLYLKHYPLCRYLLVKYHASCPVYTCIVPQRCQDNACFFLGDRRKLLVMLHSQIR